MRKRLASWLRWLADTLDPPPVVPALASSSRFEVVRDGDRHYYDGPDGTVATDTFLALKHAGVIGTRFLHDGVQRDEVRA